MMKRQQKSASGPTPQVVVELQRMHEAQALLRANQATSQAGFTAERIPPWFFARRPILMDDGPKHLEHRKQLVRFFSPRTLEQRHRAYIERTAASYVEHAQQRGSCQLDDLALEFSVQVASQIVGLTAGSTTALAKRLEAFLRQPPVDHTLADHGRTNQDWARAARNAIAPLVSFYWRDVRPAIKAHRTTPRDDIISHLLELGYRPREILMECLTYGTAGMVTTREFISMTMLKLLSDQQLRDRYLAQNESERLATLGELIRLEPPVAHLYRRVQARADGCPYAAGTLVDVNVQQANRDAEVFAPDPAKIDCDRGLKAAERTGLSFGDGAHRCPGSHLALLETDALVRALLAADARIERVPDHGFDSLVQGYQLRGFTLSFGSRADAS